MDLHRSAKVPDWEKVPEAQWNTYQRRAAETNGWDTPGNRESLKGLTATLAGFWALKKDKPVLAAGLIAYGRYKDIRDGKRADQTGTKSPKGEMVDASIDKLLIGAAIPVFIHENVITIPEAIALGIQHSSAAALTGLAKARGREIHPSQAGKLSTFAEWLASGLGIGRRIAEKYHFESTARIIDMAEMAAMTTGLALGAVATYGYVKDAGIIVPPHQPHAGEQA